MSDLRGMLRSPDPYRRRYALRVLSGGFGYVSTPAGILEKDVIVPQPKPPVPNLVEAVVDFAGAVAYAEQMFHATLASAGLFPASADSALQAYADAASAYFQVFDQIVNKRQTDDVGFGLAKTGLYHGDALLQDAIAKYPPPAPSGGSATRTTVPDAGGKPWWKSWKVWLGVGGAAVAAGGAVYAIRRVRRGRAG